VKVMSEENKLLSIPEGLMKKADREKMSLNIHDQVFISRVLGFHYEGILSKVSEDVSKIISAKYDEQTKTLAQVLIESHNDHMREIEKFSEIIKSIDKKLKCVSSKVNRNTKNIAKLKNIIEDKLKINIKL
jgi:C4-type Zn-finger protein